MKKQIEYKDASYRRQLSFVVDELVRITNINSHKLYPIVRKQKLIENYGQLFCCEILAKIPYGKNLAYCLGTLKNEYLKTGSIPRNIESYVDRIGIRVD